MVACFGDLRLVLQCYKLAVQHRLKDGKRAHQGEHQIVQSDEGRTALAASRPTAIACRWASQDEGTLTGVYVGPLTVATHLLFLPFPIMGCQYLLGVASRPTVRTLVKLTTLSRPS